MAIIPNQLLGLVAQLSALVNSPTADTPEQNNAIEEIAEKILSASRPNMNDSMQRLLPYPDAVTIRLFMDWNVFETIPLDGSISYTELASKVNAEESILVRYAWVLVARRILRQVGEDRLAHTEISKTYLPDHPNRTMFEFYYDEMLCPAVRMPEYFARYGRREPVGQTRSPFSFGHGAPEKSVWEIINQSPERVKRTMKAMDAVQHGPTVAGVYDFGWLRDKIPQAQRRGSMLFVDVGSGMGHITKAILQANAFIPREMAMLEDRQEVMDQVEGMREEGLAGVRLQTHDFHQTQPVKNALVYFICRCLHNYGDETSAGILSHLSDAMAPDGKILIAETVMSDPPQALESMFDFTMVNLGGKERTEKGWSRLVGRAGLRIEKVYGAGEDIQIIECVKASSGR